MRVLITLDGSPLAERALARLAPWIATWQAEVSLLSILDPRETHETVSASTRQAPPAGLSTSVLTEQLSPHAPAVVIERGRALESVRAEAEDSLRELATRYLPGRAVGVTAEFEEDPAEAIADFVRE